MQEETNLTVGQWCDQWFATHHYKWNGNTEGGYRNLIYSHILPGIGSVALSDLTEQTIINFYDSLRSQGLGARSVWCIHLLLRRCMDEAAQDQLIPYNPVLRLFIDLNRALIMILARLPDNSVIRARISSNSS